MKVRLVMKVSWVLGSNQSGSNRLKTSPAQNLDYLFANKLKFTDMRNKQACSLIKRWSEAESFTIFENHEKSYFAQKFVTN